jgi:hypothetical protein
LASTEQSSRIADLRASGGMADASDLQSTAHFANEAVNTGDSAKPETVLASCLALLSERDPDFVRLLKVWPELPEPIRAAILAMVKATTEMG